LSCLPAIQVGWSWVAGEPQGPVCACLHPHAASGLGAPTVGSEPGDGSDSMLGCANKHLDAQRSAHAAAECRTGALNG
jgi:hypothetical protein